MDQPLPPIPAKRYFTIGEVSELCGVKPHVLRYWEQEFTQLRPMKRRGNRRYYQHHEVLMIRRIRDLLYDQGFTISGARNRLQELGQTDRDARRVDAPAVDTAATGPITVAAPIPAATSETAGGAVDDGWPRRLQQVRRELSEIRDLLTAALERPEGARETRAII